MKMLFEAVKLVLIGVMLAVVGFYAYELTVWNYYTAKFVYVIAGELNSGEETVLGLFVLSAIGAPFLGFVALLSFFLHEWSRPSDPDVLRSKAEEYLREADAVERFREQRRKELLISARNTTPTLPWRGPR